MLVRLQSAKLSAVFVMRLLSSFEGVQDTLVGLRRIDFFLLRPDLLG